MKKYGLLLLLLFCFVIAPVSAFTAESDAVPKHDISLRLELENAIGKGLTWLAGSQFPQGHWSQAEYPALTALALIAFQGDPSNYYKIKFETNIKNGYDYLLTNVKPDGGIYGKDLANYNTSISMVALQMANQPLYEQILKNARKFIIGLQDDFGEKGETDDPFDGGIGYGGRYKHSDMSNTSFALEALYYTRYLKTDENVDQADKDLNWEAALKFISRSQNLTATNDQDWASDDPANKGGFIYFPGNTKVKESPEAQGQQPLRSYGSISYAGLLSLVYADLGKDDPRVKAVLEWLANNYTLDENPGMGPEGHFFYLHAMAKALSAADVQYLTLSDGTKVNWRKELAHKLLNLQKADGSWVNDNGRWWERDPNLVTSYATVALEIVYRGL